MVAGVLNTRVCFPQTLIHAECILVCFKPQEIQYLEEEHHRAKTTLQSRVKDREDEIQKLRHQVSYFFINQTAYHMENTWKYTNPLCLPVDKQDD